MKPRYVFYWVVGLLFLFDLPNAFSETACTCKDLTTGAITPGITTKICRINFCYNLLWGTEAPEFRLALGMWSIHSTKRERNGNNDGFGFSYKGYFAGTLRNSFSKRAYAVGIQRYWAMGQLYKDINYEFGYRLGLVSGYKGHNVVGIRALKNSPVIPFAQLVVGLNWKYIGWEISTPNPQVLSTGFYIRF